MSPDKNNSDGWQHVLADRVQVSIGSLDEPPGCRSTTTYGPVPACLGSKPVTICPASQEAALRYHPKLSSRKRMCISGFFRVA